MVNAASGVYVPGRRDCIEVKSRDTVEVIIGAVTARSRPDTVVVGLIKAGVLTIAGKSVPLSHAQASSLAKVLTPAGPEHPWPDEIASSRSGSSKTKVALPKVEPVTVAEVLADSAYRLGRPGTRKVSPPPS